MKTITIKPTNVFLALIMGLVLTGCSSKGNSPESHDATEDHSVQEHETVSSSEDAYSEALHKAKEGLIENEVLLTEKQMKAAGIHMGMITRQQLSKAVKSFGELVLAPSDEATVNALIGGIIKDITSIEGDYVRKGEVLARIVHPDIIDMQQEYLDANNRDEYLRAEYLRQKRLLEDSVNAEKTVQNARADYQSNLAKLNSLKKKLQLIHINTDKLTTDNIREGYALKAPISGFIAQVNTNTGNHVSPQQSLFHITANEKAHIDLKVYEKDISKIAQGQNITFNLANNPMNQPMEGEVIKMAKRFDPEQRTATVHARVKEMKDHLLPGMSVVAYIQTGGKKQNTLPDAAFVSDQGEDYVFMLTRKGTTSDEHTEEGNKHKNEEKHEEHANEHNEQAKESHFYVFEKVKVNKGITQGAISGFTIDNANIEDTRFVINNAQAILSEIKKGGGHSGHAH